MRRPDHDDNEYMNALTDHQIEFLDCILGDLTKARYDKIKAVVRRDPDFRLCAVEAPLHVENRNRAKKLEGDEERGTK